MQYGAVGRCVKAFLAPGKRRLLIRKSREYEVINTDDPEPAVFVQTSVLPKPSCSLERFKSLADNRPGVRIKGLTDKIAGECGSFVQPADNSSASIEISSHWFSSASFFCSSSSSRSVRVRKQSASFW